MFLPIDNQTCNGCEGELASGDYNHAILPGYCGGCRTKSMNTVECSSCHELFSKESVRWIKGDPFRLTSDGEHGAEHPYCGPCASGARGQQRQEVIDIASFTAEECLDLAHAAILRASMVFDEAEHLRQNGATMRLLGDITALRDSLPRKGA